ncbi:Apyrase [Aphelenchoides bicaudatus]|nr:Apyrase [Aphelenchoides bicaudatus]
MHGFLTAFSIWQFIIKLTKPADTVQNPWHPRALIPPQVLIPAKNKVETAEESGYDSKHLYELKLLNDDWVQYPIMAIADQDKLAAYQSKLGLYTSSSVRGYFNVNLQTMNFTLEWVETFNYTSSLNSKGRGMELSDLKVFNGKLYAPDDKTSVIFRLTNNMAIPWTIEADGDGLTNKTFKTEWLTIKDEELYVGGYGKEYTDKVGNWQNDNPLWVKVVDRFGRVRHVNWTQQFQAIRRSIGIEFPAYMIHESCQWSDVHQQWFFLPRKVSLEAYNENTDPYKAGNYLIRTDETFEHFTVVQLESQLQPTHGYSAFQFVPGTNDSVIIALKSEELDGFPFSSFYTVFNINGSIYVDETKVPGDYKLEGLEFVDWTKDF